ncbi:hypothetical protein [Streptomyces sp. BRA346]|uniref:hypothetical protein n=1 Tax=Streptomyces sp. BRA346 TaxID=2878199 RepID=UPI0040637348
MEQLLAPENLLALLGVVVTLGGLSYERLIPGRKRIGYRVQMDTLIDDSAEDGQMHQRLRMLENTPDLAGASLVLLRIENDGFRSIDADDYITAPSTEHRGLTATFPNRIVRDVAVTEPSHPDLLRHLPQHGTAERPGLICQGHRPPANSLTSKFLDYLAGDTGRNIIEKHGHLPCSVPENQGACQLAAGHR